MGAPGSGCRRLAQKSKQQQIKTAEKARLRKRLKLLTLKEKFYPSVSQPHSPALFPGSLPSPGPQSPVLMETHDGNDKRRPRGHAISSAPILTHPFPGGPWLLIDGTNLGKKCGC